MAALKFGQAAKLASLFAVAAISCGSTGAASAATQTDAASAVYVAELHPLNTGVAGSGTSGKARITVRGDALTITIHVNNAPRHRTLATFSWF